MIFEWLKKACSEQPHKGVDTTQPYRWGKNMLVATDGHRVHMMYLQDNGAYPEPPEEIKQVILAIDKVVPDVIDVDLWTTHPEREENLVHLVTGHELRRDYFEDAKVDARTTCWAAGKSEPVTFYGFSRFAHIMPFNLDNTPLTGKSTDATPPGSAPGR